MKKVIESLPWKKLVDLVKKCRKKGDGPDDDIFGHPFAIL